MSRSAWLSHVRLWICLALLLATNLANVIDGLELADVAKCVCEEAGLDENGIEFFFDSAAGFTFRIAHEVLREDDVQSVRVEQATRTGQSVDWNVSGEIPGLTSSLLSRQGVSTTLRLESSKALAPEIADLTPRTITVSFEDDSGEIFAENFTIHLRAPSAIISNMPFFNRNQVLRPGTDDMFEVTILVIDSENPDRNWQVVSFSGLPPGFEAASPEKRTESTFVLPLRGALPAAGSPRVVGHCSTLVVELMDENFGTTLRADLPFYALYDGTPPEGCIS